MASGAGATVPLGGLDFRPVRWHAHVRGSASRATLRAMARRIGNYELIRLLGEGAMAEVWLAKDLSLDREVAIKMLKAASVERRTVERFNKEAKTMAQLRSPHIATVYAIAEDAGQWYIAMEYLEGGSLLAELQRIRRMPWLEATRVVRQAACGLQAAHESRVIHRDIKPANVMRRSSGGEVVLVDFGLASIATDTTHLTSPGMVVGTPAFMAPEQWQDQDLDQRTDLYALACTYYHLVVGQAPFGGTQTAVNLQHVNAKFPDPRARVPDLPDALSKLMRRSGEKDPKARHQSAAEFIEELDAATGTSEGGVADRLESSSDGVVLVRRGGVPAGPWTWRDVGVSIHQDGAQYRVSVEAEGAAGDVPEPMELELEAEPIRTWMVKLRDDSLTTTDIEEFGRRLFGSLFPGPLASTFEVCMHAHHDLDKKLGLRIRLTIHPEELRQLPWEIALHARSRRILGATDGLAVTRATSAAPQDPVELAGPLRVLLCVADPPDLPPLEATREIGAIEAEFGPVETGGQVKLIPLRNCSRRSLRRALQEHSPHVVHFINHGDRRGKVAGLFLENDDTSESEFVEAALVRDILGAAASVRLVVLNVCDSIGVAYELAQQGIPSVGMLTQVSNLAAQEFSVELYQAVSNGVELGQAVTQARSAARLSRASDRVDWFAPVVVSSRTGSGPLFAKARNVRVRVRSVPSGAVVWVDGEETSQKTPCEIELSVGQPRHVQAHYRRRLSPSRVVDAGMASPVVLEFKFPRETPVPVVARRSNRGTLLWGISAVVLVASLWGWWSWFAEESGGRTPPPDRSEMVEIPAGEVLLGLPDDSATVRGLRAYKRTQSDDNVGRGNLGGIFGRVDAPPRSVTLEAFDIDRYEVTNAQYAEFLHSVGDRHEHCHPDEPRGYSHKPRQPGDDDQPVVTISWFDAYAYAKWRGCRLPTEDEWEFAARSERGFLYPWGDEFVPGPHLRSQEIPKVTVWQPPRPGAPCGMAGGVQEWTSTRRGALYMACGGASTESLVPELRSLVFVRSFAEDRMTTAPYVGFRCVRDAVGDCPEGMVRIHGATVTLGGEAGRTMGLVRRASAIGGKAARTVDPRLLRGKQLWRLLGDPETTQVAAFRIDKFEVSNEQYRDFLEHVRAHGDAEFRADDQPEDKDHTPKYWNESAFNHDNQPVVGVDWFDAYAYAKWAGKRLPTKAEWVRAARADQMAFYPWGDEFDRARCSCAEGKGAAPVPVDSFVDGASRFGVVQMVGNATEFVSERDGSDVRVLGGGWRETCEVYGLATIHIKASKGYRDVCSGFRCAADVVAR